jgi:SAM-dependent methyltransferase
MMSVLERAIRKGPRGAMRAIRARIERPMHLLRVRNAREYVEPSESDLVMVESELHDLGVHCRDYVVDIAAFANFKATMAFPADYHGGVKHGIYEEKLLEHFIAWDLLDLGVSEARWPYVDIAGASSPWARLLRDRGREAYSIDLNPDPAVARLGYYLTGDATSSPFAAATIGGASLQCAFEMFAGDADSRLVIELERILVPGGRAVISPLYMHTHACYYQSPEYCGRIAGDPEAAGYVRRSAWNVPASRKYSPASLVRRVLDPASRVGLEPVVHILRNKSTFGEDIYVHFILTLDRPVIRGS